MFIGVVGSWVTFCPIFDVSLSQCELAWVLIGLPSTRRADCRGEGGAGKSPGEAMGGGGIFF